MKKLLFILAFLPFGFLQAQEVINLDPGGWGGVINLDPGNSLDLLLDSVQNWIWVSKDNQTGTETGTMIYPYDSIQNALDVVTEGMVIVVLAPRDNSAYEEHLVMSTANVRLMTLEGQTVAVELQSSGGACLDIDANGLIIGGGSGMGFTFTFNAGLGIVFDANRLDVEISYNDITPATGSIGINVGANGSTRLKILNNTFHINDGDGAFYAVKSLIDVEIIGNEFIADHGAASGYAIQMSGFYNGIIANNYIHADTSDATPTISGIFPHTNTTGPHASDSLEIYGNIIQDCGNGIRLGHSNGADMKAIFVYDNIIERCIDGVEIYNDAQVYPGTYYLYDNKFKDNTNDINNAHATAYKGVNKFDGSLLFSGAFTDNVIDLSEISIDYTGSSGPAPFRIGTYGSPLLNADEDQSGLLRLYGQTSANGSSYDRGVFVALKTSGTKSVMPIAGLAEILAQSGNGPANVHAGEFIVNMISPTAALDATAASAWAGMAGIWAKIASTAGSATKIGSVIAPVWADNQMSGTVNGEEYAFYITSGTKPDAVFGFEASSGSGGWDQLFYFDETAYNKAPVSNTSLMTLINATQYYIPLSTADDSFTWGYPLDIDYTETGNATNETRYYDFLVDIQDDPAANAEVNAGYFRANKTAGANGVYTINGLEGVAGSSYADEAGTFRGVYGRTYTSAGATATMRTAIGGEFSARAGYNGGTDCVAENGTAFVGARIWMAPYFSAGSLSNVNNFHGLWLYNEHSSNTVTNAIFVDDIGGTGGWTNGINFSGATIGAADIKFSNGATAYNSDANTLSVSVNSVEALKLVESTTTQLLVGNGTALLPSVSFIGDPNTGLYLYGDDDIGFTAGGAIKMSVTGDNLQGSSSSRFGIRATTVAGLNIPVFLPRGSDDNTGIGHGTNALLDRLTLVAGGKEGIRVDGFLGGIEIYLRDTTIFDNGAYLSNEAADTLKITETVTKIEGDLHVTGNVTQSHYGGISYISTPGTQTIGTGGTFEKLYEGAMAYTAGHLDNFTESNGRLTYTGAVTKHFQILVFAGLEGDEAAQLIQIRIAKDGTPIAATDKGNDFTAADSKDDLATGWLLELAQNEYIEVYGTSDTNGDTFEVQTLQIIINQMD